MLAITRTAFENTGTSQDPTLGGMGLYRASDIYATFTKSVESANLDERLIHAYEFLYQLFNPRFGADAQAYFVKGGTVRFAGDSNYYVSNNAVKGLSTHSRGLAMDGNWKAEVEDYILAVVGHDIRIQGPIYQKLRELGIGGMGLYYRSSYGSFLHLDTAAPRFWDKSSASHRLQAASIYQDFLANASPKVKVLLGIAEQAPSSSNAPSTSEQVLATTQDLLTTPLEYMARESGEDAFERSFLYRQRWALALMGLGVTTLVCLGLYYWLSKNPKL